jgi:hypothetical protein
MKGLNPHIHIGSPELSEAASVAHVFLSMAKNSLLSVGQLCNEGYYVTFKIDGVTIFNSGENHPKRKQVFGHRIVAHKLAQGRTTNSHSNRK